jgi:hypothetical protein
MIDWRRFRNSRLRKDFISIIDQQDLARFGLNLKADADSDQNSITEKRVDDPLPGVSVSAKALSMRRTLPTNCGQSSSHSVNQAAKPLRRDFSWS